MYIDPLLVAEYTSTVLPSSLFDSCDSRGRTHSKCTRKLAYRTRLLSLPLAFTLSRSRPCLSSQPVVLASAQSTRSHRTLASDRLLVDFSPFPSTFAESSPPYELTGHHVSCPYTATRQCSSAVQTSTSIHPFSPPFVLLSFLEVCGFFSCPIYLISPYLVSPSIPSPIVFQVPVCLSASLMIYCTCKFTKYVLPNRYVLFISSMVSSVICLFKSWSRGDSLRFEAGAAVKAGFTVTTDFSLGFTSGTQ